MTNNRKPTSPLRNRSFCLARNITRFYFRHSPAVIPGIKDTIIGQLVPGINKKTGSQIPVFHIANHRLAGTVITSVESP